MIKKEIISLASIKHDFYMFIILQQTLFFNTNFVPGVKAAIAFIIE